MVANQADLLLPREVANIFRVTVRTLRNWERKGVLVPVRLPSGHKRYRKGEVEALLHKTASNRQGKRCSKGE